MSPQRKKPLTAWPSCLVLLAVLATVVSAWACGGAATPDADVSTPPADTFARLSARVDPVAKPRVIVMTDIANEPDDQMSMVRFLVYANEFDIEGSSPTPRPGCATRVRPDVIQHVIDAYAAGAARRSPRTPPASRPPTRCAPW